jgi:hypothetical protein
MEPTAQLGHAHLGRNFAALVGLECILEALGASGSSSSTIELTTSRASCESRHCAQPSTSA